MNVAIMQPYFFPYLGHFALIAQADLWVVFDLTQYTHKSWMTRNRVLHPSGGWNYIAVPLANGSTAIRIHEARVQDLAATKNSLLGKLSHYRKKAPYYRQVAALIEQGFAAAAGSDSLVNLNVQTLKATCDYLGLSFHYKLASAQQYLLPQEMGAGDWAPRIAELEGATRYINPLGGRELFEPQQFVSRGIELKFLDFQGMQYATGDLVFEPGLSVLDALMWNAPEEVARALRDYSALVDP
ncbi:WbqC family protein [Chromobacterium sp. ASV23]|uniref:WbqC family protein n=1 Tax=Chromobacterium sp. ASV23 TaxID=2795110 RepID=UPI0018EB76E0|nr:WbqC family protein [Chromobacterium sp. ASV23]